MKTTCSHSPFKVTRLGLADADDQVRQAVASVTLEGLKPTERSVDLVRAVATGKMTGDVALEKLRGFYGYHA